jgi:hypothetical protein
MKKIYLLGLTAMFAFTANAQDAIRIKKASSTSRTFPTTNANAKGGSPISVQQVNGNLICNTIYTASSTMNLVFKFTQTGNTSEWIDMFSLTFPTGITPNSSPNATFPTSNAAGGAEPLNAPSGQTISWGTDVDDGYGGIVTTAAGVTFTVNVTIAPGVTGTQMATFLASGDTYTTAGNPTPGDLTGSVSIYDAPFSNMFTKLVQPSGGGFAALNNCGMTTSTVIARYINQGTATESNISLNYSVNGVAGTAGVYPGPLVPGDSITIGLGTYNFSANDGYDLKAWSEVVGDIDLNNDTAFLSFSNSNSVPLTSATYSNGCETYYEYASVNKLWSGTGLSFDATNADMHSGALAYSMEIPAGLASATYTSINVFPCVDVVNGETYRISFWKKATSGTTPQTAITTGTAQTTAGTATIIKTYTASPIVVGAAWAKDSVDYTATVSGTRYFSIRAKGGANTTTALTIFMDDIMIEKVALPVGIKTISANDAISIFPNPTSGILNLNAVDANSSLEVINIIGEKVYSNTLVKGNNTVDLSGLANGAYFVKLNSNNTITTKKVVLSK